MTSAQIEPNPAEPSAPPEKPRKRKWSPLGILCFVGYIALMFYMIVPLALWSPLYKSIVLVPIAYEKDFYDKAIALTTIKPQDEFFTNPAGDKLHGWYYQVPGAKKIVLMHHGNAGNIAYRHGLAQEITTRCGASFFVYDYTSFGKSAGVPSLDGMKADGIAAYDFVTSKLGYSPKDVINYGESIGSGIATQVAAAKPCAGLILQSAVGSLPRVGRNVFVFLRPYPDFLFPNPQFNNVEAIKAVHCPVILFHGMPDTTVSYHDSEAIYDNANQPKKLTLLKSSGHNSVTGEDFNVFENQVREFLNKPETSI